MARTYKAKNGNIQYKASQKRAEQDNNEGMCIACGKYCAGVEPDARKYVCQSCKAPKVYGLEELVLMGLTY